MSKYDPLQSNSYTEHLAEVNNTKQVIATEDIYNTTGSILVTKGSPITDRVAQQILRFKLTKPLHNNIQIENELCGESLYSFFNDLIINDLHLKKANEHYSIEPIIRAECHFFNQYAILKQKITVLSIQLPELFMQTISTTWFAVLIAVKMGLDEQSIRSTFVGSLSHDIGMLHISPEIINKQAKLTDEEWRQIQAHAVIAFEILKGVPNLPNETTLAVLEHHEQSDGTGYPRGLFMESLSLIGQVIALADSTIAIYTKRLSKQKRSLRDVIPIIQMNSETHLYKTYEALITILRSIGLPEEGIISDEQMPAFISDMLTKNQLLTSYINEYEQLLAALPTTNKDKTCNRAQSLHTSLTKSISGSGILNDGYIRWLEQVRGEKLNFAYREMEDVFLMMEEVDFHLSKLKRLLSEYYLAEDCTKKSKSAISACFEKLEELKKGEQPSSTEFSL